ncbi:circumsporozoite protein-like [Penaeus vannamei]|uniref:circumsporozoite protein-like n=1 Tax=Penaeus vannamei TaxID=6689 RepID=UPI00387F8369
MQLEKNRNTKRRNRDEGKAQGHSTAIQAEQSRPVVAGCDLFLVRTRENETEFRMSFGKYFSIRESLDSHAEYLPTTDANSNFAPQANSNFAPQANLNLAPQANSNFAPQANSNLAPQANSNFAPQANSNFAPQANLNLAAQANSNLAPQANSNFAPQANSNLAPQANSNFPTRTSHLKPTQTSRLKPTQTRANAQHCATTKKTSHAKFCLRHCV